MPPTRTSKRSRQPSASPAPDATAEHKKQNTAKRTRRELPAEQPTRSSTRVRNAPDYGGHRLRSTQARKETQAAAKAADRKTKAAPKAKRAPIQKEPPSIGLQHLRLPFTFDVPQPSTKQRFAMFAFGQGDDGQFGLGPVDEEGEEWSDELGHPVRSKPVDSLTEEGSFGPRGLRDVVVSLSQSSYGLDSTGQLWSWGYNEQGQLGRPTVFPGDDPEKKDEDARERQSKPGKVESLKAPDFITTKVASGDQISAAISEAGKISVWGAYRGVEGKFPFSGVNGTALSQPLPVPLTTSAATKIVDVAAGNDHFVACDDKGHVWTWGTGEFHTLGREVRATRGRTAGKQALDPESAENISKVTPHQVPGLKNITAVAAGFKTCFAISKDGKVFAWGANNFRQTGLLEKDKSIVEQPTEVDELDPNNFGGSKIVQIVSGEHHSVFLFEDGTVRACGRCDSDHQVGIAATHPLFIRAKEKVNKARDSIRALSAKNREELIAQAKAEGKDVNQEIASIDIEAEERAQKEVDEPSQSVDEIVTLDFPEEDESKPTKIMQLSAGPRHTLAVSTNGYVYTWGSGQTCQLGHGDMTDVLETPSRIRRGKLAKEYRVFRASAGGTHNLLLAQLREEPADLVKPNEQMVDATLQIKHTKPQENGQAEANGDTEMATGEANGNGDAEGNTDGEDTNMAGH